MGDLVNVLIILGLYAYIAFCIQTISKRTNTKDPWMAWVPILNIYLLCKIAGKPGWWLILFIIPLVNIVISIIVWMRISEALKKPGWLGILTIIPLINLVIWGYLAFGD